MCRRLLPVVEQDLWCLVLRHEIDGSDESEHPHRGDRGDFAPLTSIVHDLSCGLAERTFADPDKLLRTL
jgi:hypothetical protein